MLARDEMAAYLKRHLEDEERRTKETGRMDQRILDRMRRRGEAMKKRGWTLRRVGAEVARCREEELKWADFQDQQVCTYSLVWTVSVIYSMLSFLAGSRVSSRYRRPKTRTTKIPRRSVRGYPRGIPSE